MKPVKDRKVLPMYFINPSFMNPFSSLVLYSWMLFPLLSGTASAENSVQADKMNCHPSSWTEVAPALEKKHACIKKEGTPINLTILRFALSEFKLELTGSSEAGEVPSIIDVDRKDEDPTLEFNIKSVVQNSPEALVIAAAGYPQNNELFIPSGYLRISGKNLASQDTRSSFKSAILCLNEGDGKGSRLVVFNAFENYTPITLNQRVTNPDNCKDVIQAGPRIIEYRARKGIKGPTEIKQNFTVLGQGNGPAFYGYILYNHTLLNLFELQSILLNLQDFSDANAKMDTDKKMRVATVIATSDFSSLAIKKTLNQSTSQSAANEAPDQLDQFELIGKTDIDQPTFLRIRKN
jgi:hypothetical protein